MISRDEIAVRVKGVSKNFLLPHERVTSIKGIVTGLAKGRPWKTKEVQHALRDISFEVKEGEFFGIVGRNGSGKSTLLKILAGIYQPTNGRVETRGKLVPFIELGVGFNPELTGRENVYLNGAMLGFSKSEVTAMYDEIVAFAELEQFMDQKLKNYSSGMQVRLAFSMAIRAQADILLIDEVLAVGDADFQRKCFDYFRNLKKNKKTVIFVSHDMTAVREYCDRAILIEGSRLVLEGKSSKVATAYTRMFLESDEEAQKTVQETSKRWGNASVQYDSVSINKHRLSDNDESLEVTAVATMQQEVDNPIFGFSVKDASGISVLGTNSQIKRQTLPELKVGNKVTVMWTVPNVFKDGKHYVDVAIVDPSGANVFDWWEEAAAFDVVRLEKTPYIISPPLALKLTVNGLRPES